MEDIQMTGRTMCFLVMLSFLIQSTMAAEKADYYRLYYDLFEDVDRPYKKNVRPAMNETHVITVYINIFMQSIIDVDEKEQVLVTSGILHMKWDDSYLSWERSTYGGIYDLLVPQSMIYLPDVIVANSVRNTAQLGYTQQQVRIQETGEIIWEPSLLMVTSCDIDITYFPFDTQICYIIFETAVTSNQEIVLRLVEGEDTFDLSEYSENGQWKLIAISAEDLNEKGNKASVKFGLQLKRRRIFYILNIVLPIFFLSLTSSLVFALPADEGEKMGTGITILLSFAVYLTVVSDLVPNTSLQVSFLAVYLTSLTGMSAVSVVVCTFILRLHFRDQDLPVGHKTTRLTRFLQKMMCFNKKGETPNNKVVPAQREEAQDSTQQKDSSPQMVAKGSTTPSTREVFLDEDKDSTTWKDVAKTMDEFCFILFSFLTIFTTVICMLALTIGSEMNAPELEFALWLS